MTKLNKLPICFAIGALAWSAVTVQAANYNLTGPYADPADAVDFRPKEESTVLYGDFYSWDLLIESYYYNEGLNPLYPTPTGNDPYAIGATPGSMDLTINVYEGSKNQGTVPNDNYDPTVCGTATDGQTCDDAYNPNQGSNLSNTYFTMENRDDPTPDGTATGDFTDYENTWDADLETVLEYLTVDGEVFDPVLFYAHNQTGVNPDLFVIGQVFFEGEGQETKYFDFLDPTGWLDDGSQFTDGYGSGGISGGCDDFTTLTNCDQHLDYTSSGRLASGTPDQPFTNADLSSFVLSPGENCLVVDENGVPRATCEAFPGPLPTDWDEIVYVHNIGNQGFDYAVWAPEIDIAAFFDMGYTTMRIDFRLGCTTDASIDNCLQTLEDGSQVPITNAFLDNGDETLVIGRKVRDQRVPAPGTLVLLAGGLLALRGARQRIKSRN